MEFSILGGGVLPDFQKKFRKKKMFFSHEKYKDDQIGLINFSLLVGSGQKSVGLFDFNFLVLNILIEADINFFFKVLAKFGDNKQNKDINKIVDIFFMSVLC